MARKPKPIILPASRLVFDLNQDANYRDKIVALEKSRDEDYARAEVQIDLERCVRARLLLAETKRRINDGELVIGKLRRQILDGNPIDYHGVIASLGSDHFSITSGGELMQWSNATGGDRYPGKAYELREGHYLSNTFYGEDKTSVAGAIAEGLSNLLRYNDSHPQ